MPRTIRSSLPLTQPKETALHTSIMTSRDAAKCEGHSKDLGSPCAPTQSCSPRQPSPGGLHQLHADSWEGTPPWPLNSSPFSSRALQALANSLCQRLQKRTFGLTHYSSDSQRGADHPPDSEGARGALLAHSLSLQAAPAQPARPSPPAAAPQPLSLLQQRYFYLS